MSAPPAGEELEGLSWSDRLLVGLAQHLAAGGVGSWRLEGDPYSEDEVGIVLVDLPADPTRVVVLNTYDLDPDALEERNGAPVDLVGINVRTRTGEAVLGSRALDDAVYELLDGATHLDLGGVHVLEVWRTSSDSLGKDEAGRRERSSNYYATAQRPTQHRPQ